MRSSPANIDLSVLIDNYRNNGGEIKALPPGDGLRPNDGESWHQINQNRYKIKLDKEQAQ